MQASALLKEQLLSVYPTRVTIRRFEESAPVLARDVATRARAARERPSSVRRTGEVSVDAFLLADAAALAVVEVEVAGYRALLFHLCR